MWGSHCGKYQYYSVLIRQAVWFCRWGTIFSEEPAASNLKMRDIHPEERGKICINIATQLTTWRHIPEYPKFTHYFSTTNSNFTLTTTPSPVRQMFRSLSHQNFCTLCSTRIKRPEISKSRTGSRVTYSYHHNSSRFTFPIFKNVLLSTRRPHGRRIMNLFRKLKLSCTCSNSTSLPTLHPWNMARVKPPSVQTSPTHASYAQHFLSINVSNRAAECQISWPATARKQQRDSHS